MRLRVLAAIMPVVLVCMFVAGGAEEKESDASSKRADIKRMIHLSGAGHLGNRIMNQMISAFKHGMPQVPEKFWTDITAEIDPNEMVEMAVPCYEEHFTHDEIKELIKFYESPIGKKMVSVIPHISQECTLKGQEWCRKLGEKVAEKLQEQKLK